MEIRKFSTITCPNCGFYKQEEMPIDNCQYYYECESCKTLLKQINDDCCVYCSFGSVKCPPMQSESCC